MYKTIIKRCIDIVFSIVLIILCMPLMLILGIIIKKDGGPALFIQERSGKNEKLFKLYKFRSMIVNNDVHNLKEDDKITKIGGFIRRTSLDELPQLFNILKGDMSFIGPRPWIVDYSFYFTDDQKRRLEVKPGLTGLAQCSGRNNLSIKEKIKLDIEYVENISFKQDLKVIIKSIKTVIKKEGADSNKFSIQSELNELKTQFDGKVVI